AMAYWHFFPAADGWGRVPVWGFANVARSRCAELAEGERVYGYLPMSTHLLVQPARVTPANFVDASAHRAKLPAAYQQYRRCSGDPGYRREFEDQQALLFPLYITSFLIEDFLADNQLFGARRVVLASASSKTALGLAFLLRRNRPDGCVVTGLTSARNRAFCQSTGYYDEVLGYEDVAQLPREAAVFVDMAGDGKLLHAVHHHYADALRHSCIVGATHWEQRSTQHALPGPKPQFFFAPDRIRKRAQDWGPGGIETRFADAWRALLPSVAGWLQVTHARGATEIEASYRDVLEGRAQPQQGHILSFAR
ncbi:MAG TPA: DUF2855 family protein, partial [Nevskiaceae bacterium]|nr:DUF2855 family protein [Nevskiaceae bacterium]